MTRAELKSKLLNKESYIINIQNIEQEEYNTIIEPLDNWITKMKTLGHTNLKVRILRNEGGILKCCIELQGCKDIYISKELKHISFEPTESLSKLANTTVTIKDPSSIHLDEEEIPVLINLITLNVIQPNIKLMQLIEESKISKLTDTLSKLRRRSNFYKEKSRFSKLSKLGKLDNKKDFYKEEQTLLPICTDLTSKCAIHELSRLISIHYGVLGEPMDDSTRKLYGQSLKVLTKYIANAYGDNKPTIRLQLENNSMNPAEILEFIITTTISLIEHINSIEITNKRER